MKERKQFGKAIAEFQVRVLSSNIDVFVRLLSSGRRKSTTPEYRCYSFQFNQFRLAEMATKLQAARLMVRQAARTSQENRENATQMCAMAKYYATETCFEVS